MTSAPIPQREEQTLSQFLRQIDFFIFLLSYKMKATSGKFDLYFKVMGSSSICWLKTHECTSLYLLHNKEEWSAVTAEAQLCRTMPLDHKEGKDTEVPGRAERTQLCCESFVTV